jgi:hypothetical protein
VRARDLLAQHVQADAARTDTGQLVQIGAVQIDACPPAIVRRPETIVCRPQAIGGRAHDPTPRELEPR